MANDDFLKVIVPDVELKYPRLAATYRYNTGEKRSEQCQPTASGAAYTVNWVMPMDAAAKLHGQLKAHFMARKAVNAKIGEFKTVFGMKKLDDGMVEFRAKRNGTKADGTVNDAPKVIGGDKQPLADPNVWSGSVGTIRFYAAPTVDPDGNHGLSLFFDAVQVTKCVYGGGGLDDFSEKPMEKPAAAADPFGEPAQTAYSAPKPRNDLDDEIPF